jgi:SAM-dependent methyltransferase
MRFVRGNSIDICQQLETWFQGPGGQYLFAEETRLADSLLEQVFGYHLLQLGVTRSHPLGLECGLNHKIYAAAQGGGDIGLLSESGQLPFENDSIDVVVLHHALEFADDPHGLLREVHRVVAPQGYIMVFAFNPLSLFGLNLRLRAAFGNQPWCDSLPLSTARLRDWLHLLGAQVDVVRHCYELPPLGGEAIFNKLSAADGYLARHNVPCGGVYAMRAQKKTTTLTPTRARWKRRVGSSLIDLAGAKPVPSPCKSDIAA